MTAQTLFDKALAVGRPPTIKKLFPHSRALLVSGKVIDQALRRKGKAMTMAANGRNYLVIRGALQAAQRANAALIIEIAKSESTYCPVNFWNLARLVDAACNELGITIPVAVHADHYGLKSPEDVAAAKIEIPTLFDAGITSIAIDASHMPDDRNLLANLELNPFVPSWAGLETEVGEIKGAEGLSTVEDAGFLIKGLNAHDIFPNWIALNNGSAHGIEASGEGIQVDLTARIHEHLKPYGVAGAQHGTSGNSSERLRAIASQTNTTKANVATALQMVSWGVEVNDYGNALMNEDGSFRKVADAGVTAEVWDKMVALAEKNGWRGGNFKKLNLPIDNWLLAQPREIRDRMSKRVEEFVYQMLVSVFNAGDTAPLAMELLADAGSYDIGTTAERLEDPADWTHEKIVEKAQLLDSDKGPQGDFDD
ncbi:class II fructose-bisphosphate aldolase [Desulfofustis glycolicus]|uniref:Fructose-bisphosphate aldolase n=1 Tax=Desulfofustis glycolicus DSM 9705 TaxID=1121409 RepID=A0A1M5W5X7_9BACT|nr:class II fructose-bisphosphate aldolase [Desulfofustis glycolicus]MCB2217272.1 class II fructose-bisphosphate aldolase [Desulfobulbaceae bacterium]SHH82896.1 fructose-bisphosphate aldolase [Desulfofustis glycolicus DSM 9705]